MPSRKSAPARNPRPAGIAAWTPSHIFCFCALTILTVATYANSLQGAFVFDDLQIVMQNSALMNVKAFGDVVSLAMRETARKLLFFSYGLNYYLGGLQTFGYHLGNVILHVTNVLLVYGIILEVLGEDKRARYVAFAGSAVFAVHTLLSSAVSYIAGRSSILCGTFYFGAIYLFFKGLNSDRRDMRLVFFGLTAVSGWLAWEAKQEAITLPLFLAAVLLLRAGSKYWRWIPPLALIPLLTVVVLWNQIKSLYAVVGSNQVLVSAGFEKVLPVATYVRTYVTSLVDYYFWRFLFPTELSVDPLIAPVEHWYSPEFLFSLSVLGLLVWLTLRVYKQEPLLGIGITAMIVSPLLAYAAIPLADVVQEHRAYIAGLGIAFIAAWFFHWLDRNYASLRWVAPASLVLLFGAMTISRNAAFANNIALWQDAEAKAPLKPRPHFNLGQAYQDAQRYPDAIREYEHALALKPDIHAAYSNLAAIYLDQRQLDKGEEMLLKVTSLSPNFTEGFINLAVLYIRKREPDKALAAINRALEINPSSFAALFNKGEVFTMMGDYKAALENYKRAVELRPDLGQFRLTLGNAYARAGDPVSAEKQFDELTGGPLAADAYRSLGGLYNVAGQPDRAMEFFRQAERLRPVFPDLHNDIGLIYLKKDMFDEAIEQFRTALQQQPDHGPALLNLAAAYQRKGDIQKARQELEGYVQKYSNSNSPYVAQARQRLVALQ